VAFLLFLFHFFVDWASSFPAPLGPYFVEHYHLSTKMVSTAITALGFLGSITQPLFALWAGRMKNHLLSLYLSLSGIALALSLFALPLSFVLLFGAFLLLFLANASFHPVGAALSGVRGNAFGVAFFTAGGIAGGAVGPLFITWFASRFPLSAIVWVVLLLWGLLSFGFWRFRGMSLRVPHAEFSWRLFRALFSVFLLVGIRTFFTSLFHTFLPLYVATFASFVLGGMLLSFGVLVGFFANFLGVRLARVFPIWVVNVLSFVGLGVGLFFLPGMRSIPGLFLLSLSADFSAFLTMSVNVHEAQEILPEHRVFASSVAMGLAWSFGNLLSFLFASAFGDSVAFVLRTVGVLGMVVALFLLFVRPPHTAKG
jgi:FSR family fosmidomycin resistance protein-like MFS transporter